MADLGLLAGRSQAESSAMVVSAFTSADADTRDNALDLAEFTIYYQKATAPRLADILKGENPEEMAALRAAFGEWAAFGARDARAAAGLGTAHWMKLCRDTGLVGPRGLTPTEADLVFARVKPRGAQRISFFHFVDALGLVGQRLGAPDTMDIVRRVISSAGPALNGTTVAVRTFGSGEATKMRQGRRLSAVAAEERFSAPEPKEKAPLCPTPRLSISTMRKDSGLAAADALLSPMLSPITPAADIAALLPPSASASGSDVEAPSSEDGDAEQKTAPETPEAPASEEEAEDEEYDEDAPLPEDVERVLIVFGAFASFGTGGRGAAPPPPMYAELDSKQFAKLCRDAGLVSGSAGAVAVDLCFAKARPRGARRLTFSDFLVALALLAQERGASEAEVLAAVADCSGPRTTATTAPQFSRLHDDRSTYTGVYARGGPKTVDTNLVDIAKLLSR